MVPAKSISPPPCISSEVVETPERCCPAPAAAPAMRGSLPRVAMWRRLDAVAIVGPCGRRSHRPNRVILCALGAPAHGGRDVRTEHDPDRARIDGERHG